MKFALVVGHHEDSKGAENGGRRINEWDFNKKLTSNIMDGYSGPHEMFQVFRTYPTVMPYRNVNELNVDFAVSFHCNAFRPNRASGTEVLYYHTSEKGKKAAQLFQDWIVKALELPDRGILPRRYGDRGISILKNTRMPVILIEPFFIDNNGDLDRMESRYDIFIENLTRAFDDVVGIL